MRQKTDKAPHIDSDIESTDFPKPQAVQLQEGTLILMEDALEDRSQNNRRVADTKLPADEERRKTIRRREDSIENE